MRAVRCANFLAEFQSARVPSVSSQRENAPFGIDADRGMPVRGGLLSAGAGRGVFRMPKWSLLLWHDTRPTKGAPWVLGRYGDPIHFLSVRA